MRTFILFLVSFVAISINARAQIHFEIKGVYYKISLCKTSDTSMLVKVKIENPYRDDSIFIPNMWSNDFLFKFDSNRLRIASGSHPSGGDLPPNAKMQFIKIQMRKEYIYSAIVNYPKGSISDSTDVTISFDYITKSNLDRIKSTGKAIEYSQYLKFAEIVSCVIPFPKEFSECRNE